LRTDGQTVDHGRFGMLIRRTSLRRVRGFSLVELMVALVAGLIVVGAVLALVVSIMKSNRETLQSTRLNQELRATLAVIANDLRRARGVTDPLTMALAVGGNPYKAVNTANGSCVIYAYDGAIDGPWHVIKLAAGTIVMQGAATKPANCSPAGTPIPLGSNQVEITALTITPITTSTTPPASTDESIVRQFTVTITGRLIDQDPELSGISRTLSQVVYVRAVGAGI
jgi:Tfp pilus assembly protein PilW